MNTKTRVVSALWFLLIANYLDRVAMSFAGPSIMKALSISPAAFGLVLSSFSFGYFLSLIPGGLVADRWGARTMLIVGPMFWALFTGLTGAVATVGGFVVVRTCFGITEGLCNPANFTIIGDHFEPRERARAFALFSSAGPLAPAFAGTVVGLLIQWQGWRLMFVVMMVPALLAGLLAWLLIPARPASLAATTGPGTGEPTSFRSVLREPSLWLLSLAALTWNIPYWGYLGWMPSYLALEHHIKLKALGPISSIPYVFGFLGMLSGGWLGSGWLHRHCVQLVIGSFLSASLFLFLAYRAPSLPLTLTGLSGAAFFLFGSIGPVAKVVLQLAPEKHRASYAGVYSTAGQIGAIIAPTIIGYLVGATGSFALGFAFMIASFCISATCLLALTRYTSRVPKTAW